MQKANSSKIKKSDKVKKYQKMHKKSWVIWIIVSNLQKMSRNQGSNLGLLFDMLTLYLLSQTQTIISKYNLMHRPEKFSVFRKFLFLWNESPRFWKIRRFSGNAGQFLNDCFNFSLPIRGDNFLFLSAIECSSIQKFGTSCGILHILPVFGKVMVH